MAKKDYYEILGVSKDATDAEIKSAFRKKAKEFHPDVNKDPKSPEKFKECQEAYEVLGDKKKRSQYDQFGHNPFNSQGGFNQGGFSQEGFSSNFGDMGDIFESMFSNAGFDFGFGNSRSRKQRGQDRLVRLNISFEEAIYGISKKIPLEVTEDCPECHGAGGFESSVCSHCNGTGMIREKKQTLFGAFMSEGPCPYCNGTGETFKKKCNICNGAGKVRVHKDIKIDIPAGINTGNRLRLSGKGEPGADGGPNGDLYIEFVVDSHPFYQREMDNIYIEVPLTISEAIKGVKKEIPTLYGKVTLNIPAGTQDGTKHRLRGKGVKNEAKGTSGDMYAIIKVVIPNKLSKKEKTLINQLEKAESKSDKTFKEFDKYLKNSKKK